MIVNKFLVYLVTRWMPILELANSLEFSLEEFMKIDKNINRNKEIFPVNNPIKENSSNPNTKINNFMNSNLNLNEYFINFYNLAKAEEKKIKTSVTELICCLFLMKKNYHVNELERLEILFRSVTSMDYFFKKFYEIN